MVKQLQKLNGILDAKKYKHLKELAAQAQVVGEIILDEIPEIQAKRPDARL